MQGVLLSFHLSTLVRKGVLMETNRTTSRRALALIQIWASAADAASFARCVGSLSRLTPISRRCRGNPTERARKVLLRQEARCLVVLWSLVVHSIAQMYKTCKREYPTPILPQKERPFIPQMNQGAFWAVFCKRVNIVTSLESDHPYHTISVPIQKYLPNLAICRP